VAGLALGNSLDLSDIALGGSMTLGYTPKVSNTGGTLYVTDGSHIADIALLGYPGTGIIHRCHES
jgi:hypothetical protein